MLKEPAKKFLDRYLEVRPDEAIEETPKIHVDEIASKVAVFYENVRNIVDYHEEHLLRKRFIDRVLRRRLFLNMDESVAEPLIKEIIRSGHLKNDSVPEAKIPEIQGIINNLHCLMEHQRSNKDRDDVSGWLMTMSANAIEESLFSPRKEMLLSEFMFEAIRDHVTIEGRALSKETTDAMLFIAIQKTLLKVDKDQLEYRLLRFLFPHWNSLGSEECRRVAPQVPSIKARIETWIQHPLVPIFSKFCSRYATVFYLVGDILESHPDIKEAEKILSDETQLGDAVRFAYQKHYRKHKRRLRRLAFLSVISFFISKIAVALAIEIPIETNITESFSLVNTAINIAFPPFLMFVIVRSIKLPGPKNADLVVQEAKKAVLEQAPKNYVLALPKKRNAMTLATVRFFYLVTFVVSLYILTTVLRGLHFNGANIVIFVFFTSLVAATGVKINNRAKELSLEEKKSSFLWFIFDLFVMPFVGIGRSIIAGITRFNVIVILINLLIELPFQFFIEFVEHFNIFIKSKKEEIE